MSDQGRDIRLEVAFGAASPSAVTMHAGQSREIFSVGFEGAWSVAAEGVAAIHAYFVFDGADLFVASADATRPATMGSDIVPLSWMQVPVPGEITLGRAVLRTRFSVGKTTAPPPTQTRDSERTQANAPNTPPPAPPPAAPRSHAARPSKPAAARPKLPARAPESERTRFAPVEGLQAPLAAPSAHDAAQGMLDRPSSAFAPPPSSMPVQPSPAAMPAPAASLAKKPNLWTEASLPKKIIYVLLPVALFSTLYTLRDDESPSATAPSPRGSAAASATSVASNPPAAATTEAPKATNPAPTLTPLDPVDAGTSRVTPRAIAQGKRTPDREVVDLIAAGSYAEAAKRLDALVAAEPTRPEYREAARILRAKSGHAR